MCFVFCFVFQLDCITLRFLVSLQQDPSGGSPTTPFVTQANNLVEAGSSTWKAEEGGSGCGSLQELSQRARAPKGQRRARAWGQRGGRLHHRDVGRGEHRASSATAAASSAPSETCAHAQLGRQVRLLLATATPRAFSAFLRRRLAATPRRAPPPPRRGKKSPLPPRARSRPAP